VQEKPDPSTANPVDRPRWPLRVIDWVASACRKRPILYYVSGVFWLAGILALVDFSLSSLRLILALLGNAGGLVTLVALLINEGHRLLQMNVHQIAEHLEARANQITDDLKTRIITLERASREVDALAMPVLRRCLDLLSAGSAPPVLRRYESELKLTGLEEIELRPSVKMRVALVRRSIVYEVVPSVRCHGRDLFLPIVLGTDKLFLDRNLWQRLEARRLDCHFPVPHAWACGDDNKVAQVLRAFAWVREPRLWIDNHEYKIEVQQEKEPLRALVRSIVGNADADELFEKVMQVCFSVVRATDPLQQGNDQFPRGDLGQSVKVRYEDTYCVAIDVPGTNRVMYRYDIPFAFPAYVSELTFELGQSFRDEFELLPPIVAAAINPTNSDDNEVHGKPAYRRCLRWSDEGAPFLPGNAVVFLWHRPFQTS